MAPLPQCAARMWKARLARPIRVEDGRIMISRTPTLADWPYRMVRLACGHARAAVSIGKKRCGTLLRNARGATRQAKLAGFTTRICGNGLTNFHGVGSPPIQT
jgi:hypothetical protein